MAYADMEEGLQYHEAAKAASSGLPPGVVEDWGVDSASLPASESAPHPESNDEDNAAVRDSPDTQMPAAPVLQPADAGMLGSQHTAAPASTGSEVNAEHSLAAQILHQGAIIAQLPAVSFAAAGANGREQVPAELAGGTGIVASLPGMLAGTAPANGSDSRDVYHSNTLSEPSQAEQGLPVLTVAAGPVSMEETSARVPSTTQAAESAAVLAPPEAQLKLPASSTMSGSDGTKPGQAASSAAVLAPDNAAGSNEGPAAGAARTSALLAPSKAQLKRARRAAALQRSAQGMPQAAGRKRAWQDWLAHKPGRPSACPGQHGACMYCQNSSVPIGFRF